MCTLHDFLNSKVRFIHASTVTGSDSCSGKNYAYAWSTSCYNKGSTLAENIRYLRCRYDTPISYWHQSLNYVIKKVYTHDNDRTNCNDTCTANVIRELYHDRDTYHYPLNIDFVQNLIFSESIMYTLIVYCCTLLL